MLEEPFFALPPPRSSGRDLFNLAWLQGKLEGGERAEDVQATLLELTCRTHRAIDTTILRRRKGNLSMRRRRA